MKKILWLWVALLFALPLTAQQKFHLTQYTQAPTIYNPAFTGIENFTDVRLGYRGQWVGFDGGDAPSSIYANVNTLLSSKSKKKKRRKGRVRYKSPYDIDKLAESVQPPQNSLRISRPELFEKYVKDSIKRAVRKLDTKAKAELRKQLKSKRFQPDLKHGLGASLFQNSQGNFSHYSAQLSYALHIPLSKTVQASLGAAAIFSNSRVDVNPLKVKTANDDAYQRYLESSGSEMYMYANIGGMIYSEKFYGGYSFNRVIQQSFGGDLGLSETATEAEHNLILGLNFPVSSKIEVTPGVLFQIKGNSPAKVNANVRAVYDQKFMAGIYYQAEESIDIMFGMMITDAMRVTYSFDYSTSEIQDYSAGSHELTLGFMLGRGKAPSPYLW